MRRIWTTSDDQELCSLSGTAHCWTERLPDARKPTSFLLASTRTGRLLSWKYGSGVQVPPNPEPLQVPTHLRGHTAHIVACDSWSPASTDTRSQSPISMQSCTVALWTPALSEVAFIDLLYSSATGAVSCRINSRRATLQGCHGITLARFIHQHKFAVAMPGQVKVIDLLATAQDHTRTYSLQRSPADERSVYKDLNPLAPVIDISGLDKEVLRVTLADGSTYDVASQADSSSTNSGACVPTDVLTVHLEGQADADLQEQISIRRPFNGFALISSLQAPSLPQLFAVSQTTDELSSLPRVAGERRSGTITLMLSHPFNSAQYGPEQERGVEAFLKAGFSASSGEAGPTPSSLFSPLLAYFVGLEDDAQRQASTGIWRLLQPYITAQQDGSLSIEQLRKLNYILIWLQANSNAEHIAKDVKTARAETRRRIEVENLASRVAMAAETLGQESRMDGTESVVPLLPNLLRLAAAVWLAERKQSEVAVKADVFLERLHKFSANDKDTLGRTWEREYVEKGGIDLDERCPACGAELVLKLSATSFRLTRCCHGHVWKRCSVTYQLLQEQEIMLCTGCGEEALAMVQSAEPHGSGPGTGSPSLTHAASRCPSCSSLWAPL